MVKLIRLKSEDNKLYFNNNIQSDLVLPPNSKIALQNLSFQKEDEVIEITSTNNKIIYDNGSGNTTINLTNAIYDKDTFKNLLLDMEDKLNVSLSISNPFDIGCSFDIRTNSSNKMVIETDYGIQINPTNRFSTINVDKSDPNNIVKSGATSAWDANIGSNSLSAYNGLNGCGVFRCQIGEISGIGGSFYIGLSETEPQDMAGDFNPSKCVFAILTNTNITGYQFINQLNPTLTNSSLVPERFASGDDDNDILSIEASEGKIQFFIYNASNPTGILLTDSIPETYNGGKPLYPIIGIYTATGTSVKNISYTYIEDYSNTLNYNDGNILNENFTTLVPPVQDDSSFLKTFSFETALLAQTLGYNSRVLLDLVIEMNFIANNTIRFFDETECYLVECLNLEFQSYDASKGKEKRRNLLSVIQNGRERSQPDVLFDSNSLTFIDINNKFPTPLRNLQFRIINSDEGDVKVTGFSNMTILLS